MTDLTEQWKKGELEIIGKKFGNLTVLEFDHKDKLIAEYPTWQEAVNSKEFKGE